MNIYTVDIHLQDINLHPTSKLEEVFQNVNTIVGTIAGTVPLAREFGIDDKYIDSPTLAMKTKLIAEIKEKVEAYEPRAQVLEVNYGSELMDGIVRPVIKIRVNEDVMM